MKKRMHRFTKILAIWGLAMIICMFAFAVFASAPESPAAPIALGGGLGLGLMFMGTIDMFNTRTMLQALEQMLPPKSFLLDLFFTKSNTSTTKTVDIDIIKGKRRMAPFVNPMHEGKVVARTGYVTRSFEPPYVKPKMPFSGADILKRQAGEIIYQGNSSPDQRARVQLGKDLLELMGMVKRREEWMAAKALTTGKVAVVGEGVNAEVDFLLAASHLVTLVGNALWSDYTNSDPVTNLRTWKLLCAQDSGVMPTVAIFGTDVIKHWLANPKVSALLDKTKIALGQINPKDLPNGATYWGNVEGLDIYTYAEWYIDDADGVEKPMIPVDRVVLGSPAAETVRQYGAIQDLKATAAVPYFPKSWETEDPSVRWIMLQSAPLPVPTQIDAFFSAKAV